MAKLSEVLYDKVGVVFLKHYIWVLVLCRIRKVLPRMYFCPLCANGADALCALGAGTMHPVVNGGSPFIIAGNLCFC